MKKLPLFLTLLLLALPLHAQSDISGEEEAVVLSPFEVSADTDWSSYSGSKVSRQAVDASNTNPASSVAITLVKPAEAVVIQFVLTNASDEATARNQALYSTVQSIQALVLKTPGLRLEQREVRFASSNRKRLSFGRDGAQTSYASLVIFADIVPELRLADRVKQVRDLLGRVKLAEGTKLADGTVGLYLKSPSSYRREILGKIFEDLDFVKKGLGSEFEVRASGLNQAVRLRACSETEVELWIDYSFTIDSIRSLTKPKE